ncbi:ATP-binding cassette domain-containing protein [Pseudooceanicola sp. GBMRC 2024]|uniref:ATP-binding cassette domain-containing protein n=1 Tax=Pseudooceanicola albus TaxID=2692189 RepID=A0A6L7G2V9_9RHOB|nr:ATP-binding cassette domain-containing protein [Pseudooceanicola albus]MXN17848.1 ATP-binding cassette domain-containing protein [Pseudooceanicola albus]
MNSQAHNAPVAAVVPDSAPTLILEGITKSFGPVKALKGIDLKAWPGEVHAIVGENGAGKSTLINCAAGVLKPDTGSVLIKGEKAPALPGVVRGMGLSVAFQHPALAPDLTVLENLRLARRDLGVAEAQQILDRVSTKTLAMDLSDRAGELSLAQGHVLEIARALASRPAVFIFDEPTEPFQDPEVRHLFRLIAELKAEGTAIIYISHRLHEVMSIADRLSVLRDGDLIETRPAAGFTPDEIVNLIVGRPLGQVFPAKGQIGTGPKLLTVAGLSGPGFRDVSLEVRPGEIIGLAGVEGQGQRDFLRALAGLTPVTEGDIRIGMAEPRPGVANFRRAGVGFVPDDRHSEGLVLSLSIRENEGLGQLAAISDGGVLNAGREKALAEQIHADLRVKAPTVETPVSALSGGNQQKVLMGREMATRPKVMLVDEPTKGVDVGSRSDIYTKLREMAEAGVAVIVSSADGVEIEGLCDRVLVFSRGTVVAELSGADVNDARITEANLKATGQRAGTEEDATRKRSRWLSSDQMPAAILILLSLLVMGVTQWQNAYFLSAFSIQGILTLTTILALAGFAQLCVMLNGGIDLSIGPVAGLAVVLSSFLITDEAPLGIAGGVLVILLACTLIGLMHGLLVEALKLPAIVVTLATYTGLQGLSLVLRPSPAGMISYDFTDMVGVLAGPVPLIFLLVVLGGIAAEFGLFRRPGGRALRAVGSNPKSSEMIGLRRARIVLLAFVGSGALAGLAGILLSAQVGIGSATTGVSYTLMSVTAVVLGGAQIAGGRGSFLATLAGALFIQSIIAALPFLNLGAVVQYILIGGATFVAAALFAMIRKPGAASAH